MNKIEINTQNLTAKVEAGAIIGDLQAKAEKQDLFYPPDPSNLAVSTVGGSIALCSGGPRTFKYGSTKDYVIDMKVVLADGSIIKTGSNTAKNSTGYHLSQLFIGAEGDGKAKQWVLAATYDLSKRTQVQAYATKLSNNKSANRNFGINPLNGTLSAAGADPQAIGVGIRHAF
jgi:FAD/FMN-containing dehydrogenase